MVRYSDWSGVPDGIRDIVDTGRGAVCDVYRKYPDSWVGLSQISPSGQAVIRSFMNGLCKDKPKPNPPSQQFDGGQCDAIPYRVIYNVTTQAPDQDPLTQEFGVNVWGKFGGLGSRQIAQGSDAVVTICRGLAAQPILPAQTELVTPWTFNGTRITGIGVVSVTRLDGLPDECGDPAPQWDNPSRPGDPDLNIDIDIPIGDGTSIKLPSVILPPQINGEIEINIGEINVKFDLGGVEINFPPPYKNPPGGGYDDGVLQRKIDFIASKLGDNINISNQTKTNTDQIKRETDKLPDLKKVADDIKRETEQIKDKADKIGDELDKKPDKDLPIDDPSYDRSDRAEGEGATEDGIARFKYLAITLTKNPPNGKVILKTSGQIIAYAGWVEFRNRSRGLERCQIQYPNSLFPVPDGCTGYSYTLTNGARGYATVITEKPKS